MHFYKQTFSTLVSLAEQNSLFVHEICFFLCQINAISDASKYIKYYRVKSGIKNGVASLFKRLKLYCKLVVDRLTESIRVAWKHYIIVPSCSKTMECSTQQKTHNLLRVDENNLEQCFAAHIVQCCQQYC